MPADNLDPDHQAEVHKKRKADCKAGRRHYYIQGRCWYCERQEGLVEPVLDADVARLIVGQVCDILNLDGGAVVVYAEVVAFVAALRRERDSWKSAYESRQSPTDVIVKQILKDVRDLTRIVRGKA